MVQDPVSLYLTEPEPSPHAFEFVVAHALVLVFPPWWRLHDSKKVRLRVVLRRPVTAHVLAQAAAGVALSTGAEARAVQALKARPADLPTAHVALKERVRPAQRRRHALLLRRCRRLQLADVRPQVPHPDVRRVPLGLPPVEALAAPVLHVPAALVRRVLAARHGVAPVHLQHDPLAVWAEAGLAGQHLLVGNALRDALPARLRVGGVGLPLLLVRGLQRLEAERAAGAAGRGCGSGGSGGGGAQTTRRKMQREGAEA